MRSKAEKAAIIAFRKMTQLPLDDVLYSLQEILLHHLSRSSLHHCLKRHGCSILPKKEPSPSIPRAIEASKQFRQVF